MIIAEVNDNYTAKQFIDLPRILYKTDPNFISPLDKDIKAIFDPRHNNFLAHGICKRWITRDENGIITGRIAAFINYDKNKNKDFIVGGAGFFESIDDERIAFKLFDTAKIWLQQHNAKAMDGPINLGENDKYWGLLIHGFLPPSMGMNYNPPY
ncbi:MAG: GNAT family N-acetyltransferase, partial [Ginsengibacter sp.]